MRRRIVGLFLMLVILLAFTGSVHSGQGWGIRADEFGPIVVNGHPWGDYQHSRPDAPAVYRPNPGNRYGGFMFAPTFTNFAVHFYVNYVIKQKLDGQKPAWYNGKSK